MTTALLWFRRDLRLTDNTALLAALTAGVSVQPVFILDPVIIEGPRVGPHRLEFLNGALLALDAALRAHGSSLIIRRGKPHEEIAQLESESRASAVYANRDYSPYARHRDERTTRRLSVPLHLLDDQLLHSPGTVLKADGTPYTIFTPFKERWRALPLPDQPQIVSLPAEFFAPPQANLPLSGPAGVSESAAQHLLAQFINGPIDHYAATRNDLIGGTSGLSPYLHLGLISSRQVYWAARQRLDHTANPAAQTSIDTWINELIWREFYTHILDHFPHVTRANFREIGLPWRDAPADLRAWQEGQTGYPLVDAAMRQLNQTGWMPNRARMVVASFLTKHLLIDWRSGEQYFMQQLIDGDVASNNGGWQWAAGTGTDAQPFFRIFNPLIQAQKFDPTGAYVRRWLPELSESSAYPPPIIAHAAARERALSAYRAARSAQD